jgi:hypothetical protein
MTSAWNVLSVTSLKLPAMGSPFGSISLALSYHYTK